MTIHDPSRWLPHLYKPALVGRLFEKLRLKHAVRLLRKQGCQHIFLYIWRPEFGNALEMVDCDRSFYHMDDEYSFSPVEQEISSAESALIKKVDQVFIHSPALMAKKGHLNPHSLYVPNGVDFKAFSAPVSEPEDLKSIPHPRIGYIGVIKDQLDFGLLSRLAERHPGWSFVFVGPKRNISNSLTLISNLEKMGNVFFLGGKAVDELPAYAQHVDVCTLCYVSDGYTKFIYPLKINEYLAAGRPVVGVPLPSIELFRDVIRIARTDQEWSDAITASLLPEESSEAKVTVRRNFARQFDWNNQTYLVAKTMCERLGPQYKQLLESACDPYD